MVKRPPSTDAVRSTSRSAGASRSMRADTAVSTESDSSPPSAARCNELPQEQRVAVRSAPRSSSHRWEASPGWRCERVGPCARRLGPQRRRCGPSIDFESAVFVVARHSRARAMAGARVRFATAADDLGRRFVGEVGVLRDPQRRAVEKAVEQRNDESAEHCAAIPSLSSPRRRCRRRDVKSDDRPQQREPLRFLSARVRRPLRAEFPRPPQRRRT